MRFRVENEEWHDQIPNAPEQADNTVAGALAKDQKPAYSIIVSVFFFLFFASRFCYITLRSMIERDLPSYGADGFAQGSMQVAGLGLISWWS